MRKVKNSEYRHLLKSFSWRIIGSIDTLIISFLISGNFSIGLGISGIDFILKFIVYYFHERIWFNSKVYDFKIRHILKSFSWRTIATFMTLIISWLITGEFLIGLEIGMAELITKLVLYYIHEKAWYNINFGLSKRTSGYVK